MSDNAARTVPVIGHRFLFDFGTDNQYEMNFISDSQLDVTVVADPGYATGTVNHFETQRTVLRPDLYLVTWTEPATGNTVTHVQDFANATVYTGITDLASKQFWNLRGTITSRD